MAHRSQAANLVTALCVASIIACAPESRSQAATQEPPPTWAFELNIRAGDKPDEYIVYPNPLQPPLRLHAEKLTMSAQSDDGRNVRHRLSLDSSVKLPADFGSMNVQWSGFRLDYDSLTPGMYTLSANAEPGFATRTDGSRETLDVTRVNPETIYVPHHPRRLPAPGIGEQFIFLMNFGYNGRPAPRVVDEHGAPLRFDEVAARPLAYAGVASNPSGESGLRFNRLDGQHLIVVFPGFSDPQGVPGLYPLVEDQATERMNDLFGKHAVWTRGTPIEFCDESCDYSPPDTALYVVSVYRARGYAEDMSIRGGGGEYLEQPTSFRALDPLVVALRDLGGRGPHPAAMPLPDEGPNAYATFSDDWDLERAYSPISMEQSHPDWPASARNAVVAVKPKLGMTRDMISWMFGYPSTYGTIAQMNRLDTWTFDGPPSVDINSNYSFYFQKDRVVTCFPECKSRI
jgi:hypothetical protein